MSWKRPWEILLILEAVRDMHCRVCWLSVKSFKKKPTWTGPGLPISWPDPVSVIILRSEVERCTALLLESLVSDTYRDERPYAVQWPWRDTDRLLCKEKLKKCGLPALKLWSTPQLSCFTIFYNYSTSFTIGEVWHICQCGLSGSVKQWN